MAELGVPGPRQRGRLGLESSFYTSLGEGAQFQAYKHTEVELVAKRVTLSNMMASNSQRLLDLELEIRALANEKIYEHPNIVDLLDWGYDIVHEIPQGILNPLNVKSPLLVPVLYVEPASEGSLEKFLDKCLDWTIRARLCLDIAAGLECLRECRILHNDLKPENILIFGDVNDLSSIQAKLADFGHSVASDENMDLTFHEYGKTESWLPPESRDYHPDLYQVCNGDLLFKSESYAYGMLALYTLFSTPERSSSLPFDHDRMIRKTEISNCLEANQLHTQGEDISEAWASIEEKFLGEQPEHRNDVSPSALDFSDTILNAWWVMHKI
jgi:serine/threonine protein kinase